VSWYRGDEYFAAAKSKAKKLNRNLFIDVAPDWCLRCVKIKNTTLSEKQVAKRLHTEFVPIVVGGSYPSAGSTAASFGVSAVPRCIVVHPDGSWKSFEPDEDADTFRSRLDEAAKP
jgi:thiol:disulfide interchange protein